MKLLYFSFDMLMVVKLKDLKSAICRVHQIHRLIEIWDSSNYAYQCIEVRMGMSSRISYFLQFII